jgi:hypothetical protein
MLIHISKQEGQFKKKVPSRCPWPSQINHIKLPMLNQIGHINLVG